MLQPPARNRIEKKRTRVINIKCVRQMTVSISVEIVSQIYFKMVKLRFSVSVNRFYCHQPHEIRPLVSFKRILFGFAFGSALLLSDGIHCLCIVCAYLLNT